LKNPENNFYGIVTLGLSKGLFSVEMSSYFDGLNITIIGFSKLSLK